MTQSADEHARKSQKLYELARDAYATAEKRFDDAEGKIGRYLSILFVVLGLATIGAERLRSIIFVAAVPNIVFGVLTAGFYIFGLVGFFCLVRALRVQQARSLKLDDSVAAYFEKFTLSAGLRGLAAAFFGAASVFQYRTKQKLRLASQGYVCLLAAVFFAVAAAGSYFFVDLPEGSPMTMPGNGGSGGTEPETDPSPEPSHDSDQAADDASQLFEDLQKGFEGGKTREK